MSGPLAFTLLLDSLFAPVLAGAGAGLLVYKLSRGRELAMALAAITALLCVHGNQFMWPPLQAMDWLILLLPLFVLPSWLFAGAASHGMATLALSLSAAYLILGPALQFATSPRLIIAAAGGTWAVYLSSQRRGDPNRGETGALAGAALALAIIIATGGSALLGQVMAALAATSLGVLLTGSARKHTMPLLPLHAALFGTGLIAMGYADIHVALLLIPLLLDRVAVYLARPYASSAVATEGLAFLMTLALTAPLWGSMLIRRLSGASPY